jgi:hypothetical protein
MRRCQLNYSPLLSKTQRGNQSKHTNIHFNNEFAVRFLNDINWQNISNSVAILPCFKNSKENQSSLWICIFISVTSLQFSFQMVEQLAGQTEGCLAKPPSAAPLVLRKTFHSKHGWSIGKCACGLASVHTFCDMTSSWSSLENLSSRALMLPSNRKPSTAGLRALILASICFS